MVHSDKKHYLKDDQLLMLEWDWGKNDIDLSNLTTGSNKKAWWLCQRGHSWQASVSNRAKGHACPYCSGRLAIKGETDLMTVNPMLSQEWNYKRNGVLKPDSVTASAGKKVWWICSTCGHEWQAIIANRNRKRGCPLCSKHKRVSVPEQAIAFYLSKCYQSTITNVKFSWLQNMELDIFVPELMLAIEYDGRAWHKSEERDALKDRLCHEHEVTLIRVREHGLSKYASTAVFFMTREPTNDLLYLQPVMLKMEEYIRDNHDRNCMLDVNVQRDYYEILTLVKRGRRNSSFGEKCSALLQEWNYAKNGNLSPFNISVGSSRKVWWVCPEGHEWQTSIANRTNISNLNKCPYCQGKRVIKGENDLISINAPFLKDWDYKKNALLPSDCMLHSGKVAWWKCCQCGHKWKSTIDARSKHGCWVCSRKKIKDAKSKPVENVDTHIVYSSALHAEKENGLYAGAVSRCCRGERKTAGGWHWRYID